ncbi:hypothetical protein RhiirA4_457138, partial [Rhizophagus irregularis]
MEKIHTGKSSYKRAGIEGELKWQEASYIIKELNDYIDNFTEKMLKNRMIIDPQKREFIDAGLKNKLNQDDAPTEVETRYIQVEGLIQHLLDDYSMSGIANVITTIFRVPFGQGLVTTLRTSHNETFNRKILKYLDKRIDYWASY